MQDYPDHILQLDFGNDLKVNSSHLRTLFQHSIDLAERPFLLATEPPIAGKLFFIEGLTDSQTIQTGVLDPLQRLKPGFPLVESVLESIVQTSSARVVGKLAEASDALLGGQTVLLLEGSSKALVLSTNGGATRSISEPSTEPVIRGPRDGFTEDLRTNTALVRRRIRDPRFCLESTKVGKKSKTEVNIAYISGLVKEGLVEEIHKRLDRIEIDGILESGYIEELIDDAPFSPFVTTQSTERPDKVAASLLEGRAAIFVDQSPFVIIVPATFWQFIQASDDYYSRYYVGSFFRMVRLGAYFITLTLPSLYVLVASFHQEMMPTPLALTIASGREVVPFPVLFEVLAMEMAFELMREAGLRMPRPIGSAVSIVGSLVIGQAAVQAGVVGPFAVIIVAVTGIATFAIPNYAIAFSMRIIRFPLLLASGTMGLLGFGAVMMIIIMHVLSLRSFGEPYLAPLSPFRPSEQKDIIIRVPWWSMIKRPLMARGNPQRQRKHAMPAPPDPNPNKEES